MSEVKALIIHRDKGVVEVSKEFLANTTKYTERVIFGTTDPVEGLEILNYQNVALVLCGSEFPKTRRFDVIKVLNSVEKRKEFVLVAYSGGGDNMASIQAGADSFLAQPAKIETMRRVLYTACQRKSKYYLKLAQRFDV